LNQRPLGPEKRWGAAGIGPKALLSGHLTRLAVICKALHESAGFPVVLRYPMVEDSVDTEFARRGGGVGAVRGYDLKRALASLLREKPMNAIELAVAL
jgi:hypothetical protein